MKGVHPMPRIDSDADNLVEFDIVPDESLKARWRDRVLDGKVHANFIFTFQQYLEVDLGLVDNR